MEEERSNRYKAENFLCDIRYHLVATIICWFGLGVGLGMSMFTLGWSNIVLVVVGTLGAIIGTWLVWSFLT